MGEVKKRLRARVTALEASMNLRRRAENETNRRIDDLVELVVEIDKKTDVFCCVTCGAVITDGTVVMHNQWHNAIHDNSDKRDSYPPRVLNSGTGQ